MYLKKIQLNGFKSFVDKTNIELNSGVTCIVGPNGSGKSNLADAMRWVLGEQSIRSLRGIKMEDVIFAGSKKRKSVGRAEVNIILDNSLKIFPLEYSEITVTRRLFRSGESQYLINKVPCRLKDIQEIFMDTGVGKESFSIIGQGKVDWIIYSTPEERRPIFEEAAGITKYRYRKKDTLRKIEKTQANLTRIKDVIYEIENQIKPLSEQAKKAELYLHKKNELMKNELIVNLFYFKKIKKDLIINNSNINKINLEFVYLQNKQNNFIVKEEKIKLLYANVENNISIFSNRKQYIEQKKNELEADIMVNNEKIKGLITQLDSNRNSIFSIDKKLKDLFEQLEEKKENLNVCLKNKKETLSHINLLKLQLEKKEKEIKELKEKEFNVNNNKITELNKISSLESDISNYEQRKKFIEIQIDKKNKLLNNKISKKLMLNKQIMEKNNFQRKYEDKIKNFNKNIKNNQKKINENKEKNSFLHTEKNIINERLLKLQSQYSFIKDMQDKMEGYYKGVKSIIEAKKNNVNLVKDVVGVIAELIDVPVKFENAIETALGSSLQNIVTYTDEDAKNAITYLKKISGGRATFLPLNVIKFKKFKSINNIFNYDGIEGIGADLVSCNSNLLPIIRYLLGNVIVVQNIDYGLDISRKSEQKFKIVTLEGELFNPGGSITGGETKKNKYGLLGRNKRLLKIKEQEKELLQKKENVNKKIKSLDDEQENLLNVMNNLINNKEKLEDDYKKVTHEINIFSDNKKNLEEEISVLNLEYEQMKSEVIEINNNKEDIKYKLKGLKEKCNKNLKVLEDIKNENNELYNKKEIIKNNLSDLKVDLSTFNEKKVGIESFIDDLAKRINKIKKDKIVTKKNLDQIKLNKEKILFDKENLEKQIIEFTNKQNVVNYTIKSLLKKKMLISNKTNDLINIINVISKKVSIIKNKIQKYEITKARLEEGYKTTKNKILDKHGSLPENIDTNLSITNIKSVEKNIINLKKEIDLLGEVNAGSIEQYKELKKRYSFLSEQKKDLIKACDELKYVISKIDITMAERFKKTFNKVNENFNEIFNFLFCGGKAFLNLKEQNNLLEAGINIEVQPPGKKMQNISLLSGGEKALTAIALLFAFLKVKPSPFCVLDEIEAYLDESNVKRFAEFLYNFSKQTQFLVITHRQPTMEIADVLYGVTMQEPGVSKLVSARLKENDIV